MLLILQIKNDKTMKDKTMKGLIYNLIKSISIYKFTYSRISISKFYWIHIFPDFFLINVRTIVQQIICSLFYIIILFQQVLCTQLHQSQDYSQYFPLIDIEQVMTSLNKIQNHVKNQHNKLNESRLSKRILFDPQNLPNNPNHKQVSVFSIGMKQIHGLKQLMFRAEIGHYFRHSWLPKQTLKRIKHEQIGDILKITGATKQYETTAQLVKNQFQKVQNIYKKIGVKQNSSQIKFQNIKNNYLLRYDHIKNDERYGCYLFHEIIQISLDQVITRNLLNYEQKLIVIGQLLKIIQFLQQLRLCHRNITTFNLVFVRINNKPSYRSLKDWKYNQNQHMIKICGFYQSIHVLDSDSINQQYLPIQFQNIYTDPNIYQFKNPQFSSDLWSIGVIFYEMLTGKVPRLKNVWELQEQYQKMLPWQKDFFTQFFKGTKTNKITLKDFKIRIKNMQLTREITQKMLSQHKQKLQQTHESPWKISSRKRNNSMFDSSSINYRS